MDSTSSITKLDEASDTCDDVSLVVERSLVSFLEMNNFTNGVEEEEEGEFYHIRTIVYIGFAVLIFLVSLVSLSVGRRCFQFVASFVSWFFFSYAVYKLSSDNDNLTCVLQSAISVILGLVFSFFVSCFRNLALFVVGGFWFASLTHLTFSVFPELHELPSQVPQIMEKSVIYWGLLLCACIVGIIYMLVTKRTRPVQVRTPRPFLLEVGTSIIGGVGVAFCLNAFFAINVSIERTHKIVFGSLGLVSSVAGVFLQRRLRLGRCRLSSCSRRNAIGRLFRNRVKSQQNDITMWFRNNKNRKKRTDETICISHVDESVCVADARIQMN